MTHTIILLIPRRFFKDLDIHNLIQDTVFLNGLSLLFYSEHVNVEYFGLEIDNQADFITEELQKNIDENYFIQIYFENEPLDYLKFSKKEILELAISLINKDKESIRISTNGCDIDIYV